MGTSRVLLPPSGLPRTRLRMGTVRVHNARGAGEEADMAHCSYSVAVPAPLGQQAVSR
jgi:hypothetical protein